MKIMVSARNADIAPIRSLVDDQLSRLSRFEPRLSRAEVVFTGEKTDILASATLSVDRGKPIHAEARDPEARNALDQLCSKLVSQLKRVHDRYHDHEAPPVTPLPGYGGVREVVRDRRKA